MIDYELIRHEFVMTEDAIPIPVTRKIRKPISNKLRICTHCKLPFGSYASKGECKSCYNYRNRTGNGRPKKMFRMNILCENIHCRQALSEDKYSKRYYCNACYIYRNRNGIDRPKKLCKGI